MLWGGAVVEPSGFKESGLRAIGLEPAAVLVGVFGLAFNVFAVICELDSLLLERNNIFPNVAPAELVSAGSLPPLFPVLRDPRVCRFNGLRPAPVPAAPELVLFKSSPLRSRNNLGTDGGRNKL